MSSADVVMRRHPLPGGESRIVRDDSNDVFYEVELAGRLLRVAYDPRQDGTVIALPLDHWDRPRDEPIAEADRQTILDGLWELFPERGSGGGIVERVADGLHVARRLDEGGYLIGSYGDAMTYLELGRTMRIPAIRTYTKAGTTVALDRAGARWTYPAGAAVSDSEWAVARARFASGVEQAFYLGDGAARFVDATEDPAARAAKGMSQ